MARSYLMAVRLIGRFYSGKNYDLISLLERSLWVPYGEWDAARLVGIHVVWRMARWCQITDGRGENTGGRVHVGTRIRVNPSHRKGTQQQCDCLSLLGVRNEMPCCFSKPTMGPFQGPRDSKHQ